MLTMVGHAMGTGASSVILYVCTLCPVGSRHTIIVHVQCTNDLHCILHVHYCGRLLMCGRCEPTTGGTRGAVPRLSVRTPA